MCLMRVSSRTAVIWTRHLNISMAFFDK
jgi:hypothetical protein